MAAALRAPGTRPRRRGTGLTVAVSAVASLALAALVVGKWDELSAGITGAPALIVVAAVALQALALVSRSEAWYVCVRASGGTVGRRRLYRASSMGFVGGLVNGQLSSAARIAALRRSAPKDSPRVSALIAAELPILVVEAMLAALTSFTLVGPLGLPWWLPLVCVAAVVGVSLGLRSLALAKRRWLADGLAVTRSLHGRSRLVGFVLVAVFAQIARNWLLLHAVGVDASLFDAVAVLIAVVSLGQLPFGLSVGAAASVLILGPQGVAAAAAAGVLLTATGTVGGLCFAAWAALDVAQSDQHVRALARRLRSGAQHLASPAQSPLNGLATVAAQVRRAVERTCFDCLGQLYLHAALATASGDGLPPANSLEKGNPSPTGRVRQPWSASSAPAVPPGGRHAPSSRGSRS